jgi:hypothetical protein
MKKGGRNTCEIISCSSTKFIEYGDRRPCGHHWHNSEEFMEIVRPRLDPVEEILEEPQ